MDNTVKPLSVTELSLKVKEVVESQCPYVSVEGELWGPKKHTSGHFYFALKDAQYIIDAVCWRSSFKSLDFVPKEGDRVVCWGKVTTYPSRSRYQITVDRMIPYGQGQLLERMEALKKKLITEGIFDARYKKDLPLFPQHIVLVTSATGAVIKDMMQRFTEKYIPRVSLYSVNVQGDQAKDHIVRTLSYIRTHVLGSNALHFDSLIIARGGGSAEDLAVFNEESVVRALFSFPIPTISAIGHETDTTLTDFVVDKRASTPTAAATLLGPWKHDLRANIDHHKSHMKRSMHNRYTLAAYRLQTLKGRLKSPMMRYQEHRRFFGRVVDRLRYRFTALLQHHQRFLMHVRMRLHGAYERCIRMCVVGCQERMRRSIHLSLQNKHHHLKNLIGRLQSCSYEHILKRGFSLIYTHSGTLASADILKKTQNLRIHTDEDTVMGQWKPHTPSRTVHDNNDV